MIALLFNTLFFLIPLIFFKNTSELFEFSKIITLYVSTILIVSAWLVQSIKQRKFVFRRTILDWPLIIYLAIYLLATILSIDPRSSWLGYYSRFNGGLLSQICYSLLYWAFVSNMTKDSIKSVVKYLIISTGISSVIAILEHFGIFTTCAPIINSALQNPINKAELDKYSLLSSNQKISYLFTKKCFEQDIQNRVFSTFGQPNWLAATLAALIPITWVSYFNKNIKNNLTKYLSYFISTIFFVALLFTKSRSGILAFAISILVIWVNIIYKKIHNFKSSDQIIVLKDFVILNIIYILLFLTIGSPIQNQVNLSAQNTNSPALETGGTESGTIRKYVWLGAIDIFKHYPILGTGPETFAFSYPLFKIKDANITSEWNYTYNKAHNEYLNYLSTTGILVFLSYFSIIVYSIIQICKSKRFEILAGYITILVTNFFGFSVVPISLLFFLLPAIAHVTSQDKNNLAIKEKKLNTTSIILIVIVILSTLFGIYKIYLYYKADTYYNRARISNRLRSKDEAIKNINNALTISPDESVYLAELAIADTTVESAIKALSKSPFNQNIRRILFSNLVKNSDENENYLMMAETVIKDGISISPNDPQLYYELGILQTKINKDEEALDNLKKSVELKPNYKEARFALGLLSIDTKKYLQAKENLEYILQKIDPNDSLTKKYLDKVYQSIK